MVPADSTVKLKLAPGSIGPDSKAPSSAVTVWGTASLLVQVTVVPAATSSVIGLKEKFSIETAAAGASASAGFGGRVGIGDGGGRPTGEPRGEVDGHGRLVLAPVEERDPGEPGAVLLGEPDREVVADGRAADVAAGDGALAVLPAFGDGDRVFLVGQFRQRDRHGRDADIDRNGIVAADRVVGVLGFALADRAGADGAQCEGDLAEVGAGPGVDEGRVAVARLLGGRGPAQHHPGRHPDDEHQGKCQRQQPASDAGTVHRFAPLMGADRRAQPHDAIPLPNGPASGAGWGILRHMMGRPLIIAHRARVAGGPENSLSGIERAAEAGADIVELDVRRSRDGVPFVIHDAFLGRLTGHRGLIWLRSAAAVRRLRLTETDEPVPTLADVLAGLPAGPEIGLDVKDRSALAAVLRAVDTADAAARTWLWLNRPDDAQRALAALPALRITLLNPGAANTPADRRASFDRAAGCGASAVSVPWGAVDGDLIEEADARGLRVFSVEHDRSRLGAVVAAGLHGVITGDPAGVKEFLDGRFGAA